MTNGMYSDPVGLGEPGLGEAAAQIAAPRAPVELNALGVWTDHVRFYEASSELLIVWFGGINEPFMSSKLAEVTGHNVLSLRDSNFTWYTHGVLPTHGSIVEGRDFLNQLRDRRGFKRLVFCGQSSGGYGALLYAYHCHADVCIAFAPQTRNVFDGQCRMLPTVQLADLCNMYLTGSNVRMLLNLSRNEEEHENEFFWDDWRHIRKLSTYAKATIISHPYSNHAVSAKLREDGLLYRYVSAMISAYCG